MSNNKKCDLSQIKMDNRSVNKSTLETTANIQDIKVIDLVKSVTESSELENVTEIFIKAMIKCLLSITDILPDIKDKIAAIVLTLLKSTPQNIGILRYDNNLGCNIDHVKRRETLSSFHQIDQIMKMLLEQKQQVYANFEEFRLEGTASKAALAANVEDQTISPSLVTEARRTMEKTLRKIKIESIKTECLTDTDTVRNEKSIEHENIVPLKERNESSNVELNATPAKRPYSLISDQNIINFNDSGSKVSVLQIYKKTCFAGCENGTVVVYIIKQGIVGEKYYIHTGNITSINVSDTKIITTSLDGCVACFDMDKKTVEYWKDLGDAIYCSTIHNKVLYIGSKSGIIFKHAVQTLEKASHQIQMSDSCIQDIKVVDQNDFTMVIIAAEGRPVCIRADITGALLWTIDSLKDIRKIEILGYAQDIWCAWNTNHCYTFEKSRDDDSFKKLTLLSSNIYVVKKYRDHLFIAKQDGTLAIFNYQGVLISSFELVKEPISAMAVSKNKVILVLKNEVIAKSLPEEIGDLLKKKK